MARQGYPSDKADQFVVRLPPGMRDALKQLAETNRRSMNAEVLAALEMHLMASGGPKREYSEEEQKVTDLMMVVAGLQTAKRLLLAAQGIDAETAKRIIDTEEE